VGQGNIKRQLYVTQESNSNNKIGNNNKRTKGFLFFILMVLDTFIINKKVKEKKLK
jgi:hypothetical protein